MTPDQLKAYVDAIISHQNNWAIVIVIAVPIVSLCGSFLVAYLTQKGKNVATKEDIGEITRKVESLKAFYAGHLEQLKAQLSSRAHYSRVRYEREMKLYEELWPRVCALQRAVLLLRPPIESGPNTAVGEEERKTKVKAVVEGPYNSLAHAVEDSRPFYPPDIWEESQKMLMLCVLESCEFRSKIPSHSPEYWDRASANAQAIYEQGDKVCEAIRTRLTQFDEPDRVARQNQEPPK